MKQAISIFTDKNKSLFESSSAFLAELGVKCDSETAGPISVSDLYDQSMPQYLTDALQDVDKTFFIGIANNDSLSGLKAKESLVDIAKISQNGGKYDGMFVFACDAKPKANITRTEISALTRAFNRIASANPVILILRQGFLLSLATCERMEYNQAWRNGTGEKLGKVNILRNINCQTPHRGHIDILEMLREKSFTTFDELYKHWMVVFSNELLTKKFYGELSDWYAWAVKIVKFPNDIRTEKDDTIYNQESCIRLITRLIFVWFLKQKHLIPEEFFDEKYIHDNLISKFNPHDKDNILYKPSESKYYRLILQNLFFAMLNCPIVAEGKKTANNRRFRGVKQYGYVREGYNINTLMRYESEFMDGGAEKFLKLANDIVPFLNGGLFSCLDNKKDGLYYDGFSERKESLAQLYIPDYLFFGEEVGKGIDLSQWYGDSNKKNVSARGLIDILKNYSFTIEENTPYDQEVSLDPELLGKVFENLLAAYNPETQTSARKQTGSFYTPREIVQYMVDESLVAHLKRSCGPELESKYRQLLSFAPQDVNLTCDERKTIMKAIYNCRVLDPACGSGAFPMGVLQQMVHILKRIDPSNEMWNNLMVDIAIEETRKELEKVTSDAKTNNEKERIRIEENRRARLEDIENAFNQNINDPDYARKLYLIEHCIFGVDIQPIATQISKLRFFISLVVDQKPTRDPKTNFGIRPLPNLEAKFVTANTLIPLDSKKDLFTSTPEYIYFENQLRDINHRIFITKKNKEKEELQQLMRNTRMAMAQTMENLGAIGAIGYNQLIDWDMFDQNASASFFDSEWMFGVREGFDIVIGNPPFVVDALNSIYQPHFETAPCLEMYAYFYEKAIKLLVVDGILSFITASLYIKGLKFKTLRDYLQKKTKLISLKIVGDKVFENVSMPTAVLVASKGRGVWSFNDLIPGGGIIEKMDKSKYTLNKISKIQRGFEIGRDQVGTCGDYKFLTGSNVKKYINSTFSYITSEIYEAYAKDDFYYTGPRLLVRETGSTLTVLYLEEKVYSNRSLYSVKIICEKFLPKYILGCLNSNACQYYYTSRFKSDTDLFPKIRIKQVKMIPIPYASIKSQIIIVELVDSIILNLSEKKQVSALQTKLDMYIYKLYGLSFDDIKIIDPETSICHTDYDDLKFE